MSYDDNPFPAGDADRQAIWEMLVRRDSAFFLTSDWSLVESDYVAEGFFGVGANRSDDPDDWRIGFPTLAAYRDAAIAGRLDPRQFAEELRPAWFRCQSLTRVEIAGDLALAHKRLEGGIARVDGTSFEVGWRSVFQLRRVGGTWKIAGFIGYLPLEAQGPLRKSVDQLPVPRFAADL